MAGGKRQNVPRSLRVNAGDSNPRKESSKDTEENIESRNPSSQTIQNEDDDEDVNLCVPVRCKLCRAVFGTVPQLNEHITTKHYRCSTCGAIFRTKKVGKQHQKTHLSIQERPFSCSFCDRKFGRKTTLEQHLTTHRVSIREEVASDESEDEQPRKRVRRTKA